ncbi:hypothetical protein LCGC14_1993550 [marine sediment metagenome]|uniref:Uncharacterized protein n=1 Tax=marine sediment metagenome TaxID=412755 RepID=A0A0F9FTD4_9ZZZZ
MVFIFEKHVRTKYGKYTYISLGHNSYENGKSKRLWEVNIARKDKINERLPEIKRRFSKKPPKPQQFEFGLVYGLFSISKELDLIEIINQYTSKREQGFSVGEYITLLAINRAIALSSKSQVRK